MAFNIKDFFSGLAVKIKSTTDGSNGEVTHHHVDSSALPAGASTAAKQDTGNASLASIDGKLTGPISVAVTSGGGGDASAANQTAGNVLLGAVTETAPTTDTASSGLNGRLQRVAQRLTALIAAIGTPLQAGGAVSVSNLPATQAISASALPLPTGAATSAKQDTLAGLVGEVQASPTANTLLDRLKAIATALAGTLLVTASGRTVIAGGQFTRPADTTAYAVGDLVANNTTAASVAAIQLTAARINAGTGRISRARLKKSNTSLTNAQFRVHLYRDDPAASTGITNGDNGAWLTKEATYIGAFDVTMDRAFSDGAKGIGVPVAGAFISFDATAGSQLLYALIEARAAYTPASAEVFTLALEIDQD